MIAAISPADYNFDETLSTLQYANRAKSIENTVGSIIRNSVLYQFFLGHQK